MTTEELGVAPVEEEEQQQDAEDQPQDGQHSEEEGSGTGDDNGQPQESTEESDDGEDSESSEESEDQPEDDSNKRVNDLMSKWQREEAGSPGTKHGETKSKLKQYEDTFGPLPGEGQQAPQQQKGGDVPQDDSEIPAALKKGWAPKTMEEFQQGLKDVAQYGAKMARKQMQEEQQSTEQARKEAEEKVDNFVAEVKQADPEFDEKSFFKYANDNNFPLKSIQDLRAVYRAYVQLQRAQQTSSTKADKNKAKRKAPVNKPGSGSPSGGGISYKKIRGYSSVQDLVSDHIDSQK